MAQWWTVHLCFTQAYSPYILPFFSSASFTSLWWAQVDSNHRPHAYQACALTTWAMRPFKIALRNFEYRVWLRGQWPRFRKRNRQPRHSPLLWAVLVLVFQFVPKPYPFCSARCIWQSLLLASCLLHLASALVEMRRIELLTPCLQSRCSPSWATPPYALRCSSAGEPTPPYLQGLRFSYAFFQDTNRPITSVAHDYATHSRQNRYLQNWTINPT